MRPTGQNPSSSSGEEKESFAGSLLVAHPGLRDPNFRRSVLFLSAHVPETGAFGVILNRPLAGKTAADLLPDHEHEALLAQVPVYLGGPVACDQLAFIDLHVNITAGTLSFRHNLSLEDVAALFEECRGEAARRLRATVGYAGWTDGQLEGELQQNAWLLVEPKAEFFAPAPSAGKEDRSWFRIMHSLGPRYQLLAAAPDDPSLN